LSATLETTHRDNHFDWNWYRCDACGYRTVVPRLLDDGAIRYVSWLPELR